VVHALACRWDPLRIPCATRDLAGLKERGRYVEDQSKEALNFQITLAIAYIVSLFLMIIIIGFVTFAIAWICAIVFGIIAAMAANKGEAYRYPVTLRLVK